MNPVYHYTTGNRLEGIATAEEITPATAGVFPPEKPAVWLSTAAEWEHTATKGIIEDGQQRSATFEEMIKSDGCLVRIQIDPAQVKLIPPAKLKEFLGMKKATLEGLVRAAKDAGANPSQWRAVAGPIPWSAFLSVEIAKEINPIQWVSLDSLSEE